MDTPFKIRVETVTSDRVAMKSAPVLTILLEEVSLAYPKTFGSSWPKLQAASAHVSANNVTHSGPSSPRRHWPFMVFEASFYGTLDI